MEHLESLLRAGLSVELTGDYQLRVSPAHLLTPALRKFIKAKKAELIDCLLEREPPDQLHEPPGFEGTGWRISDGNHISPDTLAKFYAASQALDAATESALQKQKERHE